LAESVLGIEIRNKVMPFRPRLAHKYPVTGKILPVFKSPIQVIEGFKEYATWVENNPLSRPEQNRQPAKRRIKGEDFDDPDTIVNVLVPRPMSIWSFAIFIGVTRECLYTYAKDQGYEDYHETLNFIFDMIKNQQYEQAAIGNYKENIVARAIGLSDKTEAVVTNKFEITYEDINNED
jgi:hypothetical protein